jgi:6-pyruvoyltetrahydropterin/6-carboxytetrahydropterin synthase
MGDPFQVRVEGVGFSAGHMATFNGQCEPLHGHNYAIAADVEGSLAEDAWVVDFVALRSILRDLCDELDHRFMLQQDSRILHIESTDEAWTIKTPAGAGYVLPRSDVIALPIDNSTSERMALWLSDRIWQALEERGASNVHSLTVHIWEGPEQRASYRRERLPQR